MKPNIKYYDESKYMTPKNKYIDFRWAEWIEESVSDGVQTVLDEADSAPPVVENPDSLGLDVGSNANTVGPGISNNDNPKSCSIR